MMLIYKKSGAPEEAMSFADIASKACPKTQQTKLNKCRKRLKVGC
jgi:hypothetical protein